MTFSAAPFILPICHNAFLNAYNKSAHWESNPLVRHGKMMFGDTFTMDEFSTKQGQLFYSFPIYEEEKAKIDAIMSLLDRSGVAEVIGKRARKGDGGRPPFNPCKLFAAVVLGFVFGHSSLREIESSCRNDLRFIYVLDNQVPDYSTISRFINGVILPLKELLFSMIMKTVFGECRIPRHMLHRRDKAGSRCQSIQVCLEADTLA